MAGIRGCGFDTLNAAWEVIVGVVGGGVQQKLKHPLVMEHWQDVDRENGVNVLCLVIAG